MYIVMLKRKNPNGMYAFRFELRETIREEGREKPIPITVLVLGTIRSLEFESDEAVAWRRLEDSILLRTNRSIWEPTHLLKLLEEKRKRFSERIRKT